MKNGPFKYKSFEIKNYLHEMNLSDSRTHFKRRSNMIKIKMSQKNNPLPTNFGNVRDASTSIPNPT